MILLKSILIILIFVQGLVASNLGDAIYFFIEGEIALMEEDEKQAVENLTKALKIFPNSPTIHTALGEVYYKQKDYKNALKAYKTAYELNSEDVDLGSKIFGLHKQMGHNKSAHDFLDQLLITHPQNIQFLYEKAQIQFSNENWQGLIDIYAKIYTLERDESILERMIEIGNAIAIMDVVYGKILELEPIKNDKVTLLEILSQIAYSLEEYQKAIVHLDSLKLKIDTNAPYLLSGDIYLRSGNYEEAKINFEYVYRGGKSSFEIMRALLICYSSLNEIKSEIDISNSMMQAYPEENLGFESHALALLDNSQYSEAISTLIIAKQKFPESTSILFYLGSAYKQINQFDEALLEFKNYLKLQPESTMVLHSMALIYEDENQYALSDSLFSIILASDEHNAMDMNDYAYIISERESSSKEDLDFALNLAKRANKLDPLNHMIMDTVGWIYFRMGDAELALKHLQNSVENGGENSVILDHLGDVYLKLGNTEKALEIFRKAVELDSSNQEIKKKLEPLNE